MRHALIVFFGLALVTLFVITFAGLFAPLFAPLDLINHFRLHFLETAVGLFLVFLLLRARRLAMGAFALALVNLVLASPAVSLTASYADGQPALKIVSMNVWGRNAEPHRIEAFLRREDADIVLLLEAGRTVAPMLERMAELYPHRVDCIEQRLCRLVLLSKRPMIGPRIIRRSDSNPPTIVSRFDVEGRTFTFYGVHLTRPFDLNSQRRDINWLIATLRPTQEPILLAGDFNATPWSWAMTRLTLAAGMVRWRVFGATWPAQRPLFPQFLIDHVLTRGGLGITEVHNGPAIGSDHLPFVAELLLR